MKPDALKIIACTTFPDYAWRHGGETGYAFNMLESFVKHWHGVPLMINLDTQAHQEEVASKLRDIDRVVSGYEESHGRWLEQRHKKDAGITDYRQQCARFAHKIFTIYRVLDAALQVPGIADYVVWIDADIITHKDIENHSQWIPRGDDVISYMGRADWNHSECGFVVIRVCEDSLKFYKSFVDFYLSGDVDGLPEKHDSYIFDVLRARAAFGFTNLTDGVKGRDVFDNSTMGEYMTHYKGPAKASVKQGRKELELQTANCVPDDTIKENVRINRWTIREWVTKGRRKNKKIIMCAAGPSLEFYINEILQWRRKGHKIAAVKHAIAILKKYDIDPDYIVLLDPREHVERFVETPSNHPVYLVASMVNPSVVIRLNKSGCRVIGYHAAVNAGEHEVLEPEDVLVTGGTAAATRSLSLFEYMGYRQFELYGYDLCVWDKPDMQARAADGNPKYIYVVKNVNNRETGEAMYSRGFYAEPQWIVQANELQEIRSAGRIGIRAHGMGMAPWLFMACDAVDRYIGGDAWKKKWTARIQRFLAKYKPWLIWSSSKSSTIPRS